MGARHPLDGFPIVTAAGFRNHPGQMGRGGWPASQPVSVRLTWSMANAELLKAEGDVLRFSTLSQVGPASLLLAILAAGVLCVRMIGGTEAEMPILRVFPWYRTVAWVLLGVGLVGSLHWRRQVLFHRNGEITVVNGFLFFDTRRHYGKEGTFGLVAHEFERDDEDSHVENYELRLVFMDGKRVTLIRFASLSDLHDCRRAIERFTGEPIAYKKITDLLRG